MCVLSAPTFDFVSFHWCDLYVHVSCLDVCQKCVYFILKRKILKSWNYTCVHQHVWGIGPYVTMCTCMIGELARVHMLFGALANVCTCMFGELAHVCTCMFGEFGLLGRANREK